MSAGRDPERLIRAFLEEGPEALPDRSLATIRERVGRHPRRPTRLGGWTLPARGGWLAGVVLLVAAMVVVGIVSIRLPSEPRPVGALRSGVTYHAEGFGEPFRFEVPDLPGAPSIGDQLFPTLIGMRGGGLLAVYDDALVHQDLCDPGAIIELPQDPASVEAWLRASYRISVSATMLLQVEGRAALAWDVECTVATPPPLERAFFFEAHEPHRVYAVPTGRDTILIVTSALPAADFDAFNTAIDALVRSIRFDPVSG